jgi:hypothetical protein
VAMRNKFMPTYKQIRKRMQARGISEKLIEEVISDHKKRDREYAKRAAAYAKAHPEAPDMPLEYVNIGKLIEAGIVRKPEPYRYAEVAFKQAQREARYINAEKRLAKERRHEAG